MSTTTPNYGLVKPQLTDAADITAMNPNWDKIDEELKKKYDADNKPTASDVGEVESIFTNDRYVRMGIEGGHEDDWWKLVTEDVDGNIGSAEFAFRYNTLTRKDIPEGVTSANDITTVGMYKVTDNLTDLPPGANPYGHLSVLDASNYIIQLYMQIVPYDNNNDGVYSLFVRSGGGNVWYDWIELSDASKLLRERPSVNLLHNWYFGNPVNRNGFSTTSNAEPIIDRWQSSRYRTGTKSVTLNETDGCITIECIDTQDGAYIEIFQNISSEVSAFLVGKTVTMSVLTESGLYTKTFTASASYATLTIANECTVYARFKSDGIGDFRVRSSYGQNTNIFAIKLELGDTQTLAHQDSNGNWVLNEIPDYAEQMAICMQYDKSSGAYTGITASDVGAVKASSLGEFYNGETIASKIQEFHDAGIKWGTFYVRGASDNAVHSDWGTGIEFRHMGYDDIVVTATPRNGNVRYFRFYNRVNESWSTEWSTNFLPLDGSVPMSGNATIEHGGYPKVQLKDTKLVRTMAFESHSSNGNVQIVNGNTNSHSSNRTALELYDENYALSSIFRLSVTANGSGKSYNIFGEHNKPSGSYTGASSSVTRTIDIGGIGVALLVSSPYGHGIVTKNGAFMFESPSNANGYYRTYDSSAVKFEGGVLTLNTAVSLLNSNSYTYTYQVL